MSHLNPAHMCENVFQTIGIEGQKLRCRKKTADLLQTFKIIFHF